MLWLTSETSTVDSGYIINWWKKERKKEQCQCIKDIDISSAERQKDLTTSRLHAQLDPFAFKLMISTINLPDLVCECAHWYLLV